MELSASPMPSSGNAAYRAAKAKLAQMSPAELAQHRAALEAQRQSREREAVMAMRERSVSGRIAASGIPQDYRTAIVRIPEVAAWTEQAKCGAGGQLVLRGTNGTGKTTEACGALLELAHVMTVRFAMLDSIKRAVNGSWINRNASPTEILASFVECGCLLVDDLGQTPISEPAAAMLLEIMSERYGNRRATIYTTNFDGQELYRWLAPAGTARANAILDRIKQSTSVVMNGESLRKRPPRAGWHECD